MRQAKPCKGSSAPSPDADEPLSEQRGGLCGPAKGPERLTGGGAQGGHREIFGFLRASIGLLSIVQR
jgi:hypothetical protein